MSNWTLEIAYWMTLAQERFLRRFPSLIRPALLSTVAVETTTECTRKCLYCPHHEFDIPRLKMAPEVYRSIIDSLARRSFSGRLFFGLYGESLADDRLEAFIGYARAALPRAQLTVCTNGDLLDLKNYLALRAAGMDMCILDKHSQTLSDGLKETLTGIKRDSPREDRIVLMDYYHFYHVQKNRLGLLNNRGGLVEVLRKPLLHCRDIRCTAIDCLGNVLLCGNDCTSSYVFGNVAQRDLYDIWEDPAFSGMRMRILKGERPFEICRRCAGAAGRSTPKPQGTAVRLPAAFHDFDSVMGLRP